MTQAEILSGILTRYGTRTGDIDYFITRLDTYPYLAQAPVLVKPPSVPGMHLSVRLRQGWRLWGFETEIDRDNFILNNNALPFHLIPTGN